VTIDNFKKTDPRLFWIKRVKANPVKRSNYLFIHVINFENDEK
jgi:hypothetical protein